MMTKHEINLQVQNKMQKEWKIYNDLTKSLEQVIYSCYQNAAYTVVFVEHWALKLEKFTEKHIICVSPVLGNVCLLFIYWKQ